MSTVLSLDQGTWEHQQMRRALPNIDIFSWLAKQIIYPKVYWKSRDEETEIGALGSVLEFSDIPQFQSDNSSFARFFGGKSFFPSTSDSLWKSFPRTRFFLPLIEFIKENGKCTLIINQINGMPKMAPEIKFPNHKDTLTADYFPQFLRREDFPHFEDWKNKIAFILNEINHETLKKVVLARRTTLHTQHEISPYQILLRLKQKALRATLFLFQFDSDAAFIGASPEKLFKRNRQEVFSEAVAGTRPRGKTNVEDMQFMQELLNSEKDRKEFSFVKESIHQQLQPFCSSLSFDVENRILKTTSVQHLHATFNGMLKENVFDKDLIETLHPTPAMGGVPKERALNLLKTEEPFDRGWYASPLGWISQNAAEIIVGIRSAYVQKKALHLFAGAGIVNGSNPEKEWQELENKISPYLHLI